MKPDKNSRILLSTTRAKAKMYEYDIEKEYHLEFKDHPEKLFDLAIGILGELAHLISLEGSEYQSDISNLTNNLQFSSRFFDSYKESKLDTDIDNYLYLMGSSSYYLCNLPGSAYVLASKVEVSSLDLDCNQLDLLLLWILLGNFENQVSLPEAIYQPLLIQLIQEIQNYFCNGIHENEIFTTLNKIRSKVYSGGNDREFLFFDIIYALIKTRITNSTWKRLPQATGLSVEKWQPFLANKNFIKELWPAQKILAANGVFSGKSAVIQMPTSAGKTKAVELIIRSSFLSERSNFAVVVAPFRALCHEISNSLKSHFTDNDVIVDQLTDTNQKDFNLEQISDQKHIIVVTPEKLNYILRYLPELYEHINLVIYDESHLFDDHSRGVTYELLLSSLKSSLGPDVQTILISAVISNADEICNWIMPENGIVLDGKNLIPTYRTIAFSSWKDERGRLEFVNPNNPDSNDFFVPRVLVTEKLDRKRKERKDRYFPEKENNNHIALYLGLKLVKNGGVAIFTGKKSIAVSLCDELVDKFERNLKIPKPIIYNDSDESSRLTNLITKNYGDSQAITNLSKIGIYLHHGNIPQGIRLSIEYALQNQKVRFVICTSTLAQGVNIPIKYLIVTNTRQGRESIKTRDFHNLIGRAGRSGMHTEGSIIFASPQIYDTKYKWGENWRWKESIFLLNPENSEACNSQLLELLSPIFNDSGNNTFNLDILAMVDVFTNTPDAIKTWGKYIEDNNPGLNFSERNANYQISLKVNTLTAIESYLLANLEGSDIENEVDELIQETLAYHEANDEERVILSQIFYKIASNIEVNANNPDVKAAFSRTLSSVNKCKDKINWLQSNLSNILGQESNDILLQSLWPLLLTEIKNNSFQKFSDQNKLFQIAKSWVQGKSFEELFEIANREKVGVTYAKIDHIIDICENGLGFEGSQIIGSLNELLEIAIPNTSDDPLEMVISILDTTLPDNLNLIQNNLKYGLNSKKEIALYELGFADREICKELASIIPEDFNNQASATNKLVKFADISTDCLHQYPSYFSDKLQLILPNSVQ